MCEKFGLKLNNNHEAYDKECEIYKRKINNLKTMIFDRNTQGQDSFNVFSSNICGVLNNQVELKYLTRKIDPDVLLLNETHLTDEVNDGEIKIKGHFVILSNSHTTHTGGTCIYVKKSLKTLNKKRFGVDSIWITSCEIKFNGSNILLASVYFSPNANKIESIGKLEKWINEECENKSIILSGDLNIDVLKKNSYSTKLLY